jgi:hypothetical protein
LVEQSRGGQFQEGDGLLSGDAREAFEEVVERVAGFEVVEERTDGHARAGEAGRAAQPLGVDPDYAEQRVAVLDQVTLQLLARQRALGARMWVVDRVM